MNGDVVIAQGGFDADHVCVVDAGFETLFAFGPFHIGQGAQDDGAGVVMAMEALATLRRLNLRPRRTIRVVLWPEGAR